MTESIDGQGAPRYRLRPHVSDAAGEDVWVAAVPAGPIVRLDGIGPAVLDVLAASADHPPLTAHEVTRMLRENLPEAPPQDEAERVVRAFLVELEQLDLVERA